MDATLLEYNEAKYNRNYSLKNYHEVESTSLRHSENKKKSISLIGWLRSLMSSKQTGACVWPSFRNPA